MRKVRLSDGKIVDGRVDGWMDGGRGGGWTLMKDGKKDEYLADKLFSSLNEQFDRDILKIYTNTHKLRVSYLRSCAPI